MPNSIVGPMVQLMNASIPQPGVELDVVQYPNPFFGIAEGTFIDSSQTVLRMVDGGEDGEVIPIQPLLVKAREVDVIIAIDAVRVKLCGHQMLLTRDALISLGRRLTGLTVAH